MKNLRIEPALIGTFIGLSFAYAAGWTFYVGVAALVPVALATALGLHWQHLEGARARARNEDIDAIRERLTKVEKVADDASTVASQALKGEVMTVGLGRMRQGPRQS